MTILKRTINWIRSRWIRINRVRSRIKSLREKIAPFKDVDIIFASALTKQRLLKVLEAALQVYANRTQKIKTSELNRIMLEAIENYPPPSLKGKYVKIKYITQLPTHAPSFASCI